MYNVSATTEIMCVDGLAAGKKLTLTVYAHEIRGGPSATLLPAAGTGQGNFSALGWGSFLVFDNKLMEGASPSSTVLGRITGSGVLSTIGGLSGGGVQVVSKFWWSPTGPLKGSSITVVGTLSYGTAPWELTVVAGTGEFRGYIGYALSQPELSTTAPPLFVYKWTIHLYRKYK